jgi:hypothetical protein
VLIGDSDNLAVIRLHLIEAGSPFQERRPVCYRMPGSFFCKREDGNRITGLGEHVNALMPVLQGKINPGVPRHAPTAGQANPCCPLGIIAIAAATVDYSRFRVSPGQVMTRMIRRQLLIAGLALPGAGLIRCLQREDLTRPLVTAFR